ncbi:MAG: DUF6458 family protein [Actinomycetota bacterium]|nr:DUF6458 family protein [Actinomycetota bacterium]
MGIGTSILLIAVGAILRFAVDWRVSGIDIPTVGVILMIAGVIGLIVTLFYASQARRNVADRTVMHDRETY